VGGSGSFGDENNPLVPAVLRTSATASSQTINSPGAYNSANVPFLAFNNNVRERGDRALGELHLAYFYKGLSLLGAWDFGYESLAFGSSGPKPVRVGVGGYFLQAAYLITGETRTETGVIDPIRPFSITPGKFGLGAFEPTARFSELSVGRQVFASGFADANLWTNQADLVDVGMNWYLNKFIKIYFDWELAIYGQPVYYSPGQLSRTNNSFWARFQFYF
jgi:phosphate-selective porin OprO and OprP